jgi:hypothetical protein
VAPTGTSSAATGPTAPPAPAVDAALIEQRRSAIKAIQEARTRRLTELNHQLEEALTTLAPAHPTVRALKQSIEQASQDPPELTRLLSDERSLAPPDAAKGATSATAAPMVAALAGATTYSPPVPTLASSVALARVPPVQPNEDPALTVARLKLQNATQKYDEIIARIESAKIELDVARAAFKYRFSILRPPEVPERPDRPKPALVALAGLVAAFLLCFGIAATVDLFRGRFVEPWQVKRKLGIPLLGEFSPP